jgi:hypothetical protein
MQKLPDEFVGALQRRLNGIIDKIENGGLDYQRTLNALQLVSDGKIQMSQPTPPTSPLLLDFVQIVIVPATTEKFVAGRNFLLKQDGGICSYLWDNFKSWFLEGDGKVEEPHAEAVLRCHKLRKNSVDTPLIAELGGEKVAETTLTEMFSLLQKQANGEKEILLTNGYANIFYVRDQSGVLRAVYAGWNDDGWYVHAFEVSYPSAWGAGSQVFSRNPSATL